MIDIPRLALSIRQPWAWAIVHAGKDIENRTWQAVNHGLKRRGRCAVHAAKGMTRAEYKHAADFMWRELCILCPAPCDLQRGGIIGSVEVIDVARYSTSSWFVGPRGLVLRDPEACAFISAVGQLGYFEWKPSDVPAPAPAKWMLPSPRNAASRQETFLP